MLQRATYAEIRERMQPGDVVAFGGKGHFAQAIKFFTRSAISHVGVILKTRMVDETDPGCYYNQLIHSAPMDGLTGVAIVRLSRSLATYDGEVWWLPLSAALRARLDVRAFLDFMLAQEGKPYDTPQAILAGLDGPGGSFRAQEDLSKLFCSELVAAGLKAGGVLHDAINASEVTPIDLCRFLVYQPTYYQLAGEPRTITGFNTVDPAAWAHVEACDHM